MKLLFATSNISKVNRFKSKLLKHNIELISLRDINIDLDIEENGNNALENALIKARAYYKETNMPTIAMDDTLYFDNIPAEKQPGTNVRRVNNKRLSDEEMITYYSNLAKEYGKITARWIYGMALINNGKEYTYTWNKEDFYIVDNPTNKMDIGYPLNSISINKKLNKYFTDISEEDKLLIEEDESDVINFIINNL
ncbi:MAG: hypothetical protein IJK66_02185 [Bacilli bacterium]|nr:hypothetical protein [Bacilli bacterium]